MKLLVTGARGFVGTYFTNRYNTQYTIEYFSFLNDDINTLELKGVDAVVHLSALVHQMGGASWEEYKRVNLDQTFSLAQKAKEAGVGQFVFMSSIKACGEESSTPYNESSACSPQDDYGKSKLLAEEALSALEDDNFCVSIIRTPIIYGEGVKANIASLVRLIAKVPLLPFGDINNKRSMIYIGNLCYIMDYLLKNRCCGTFFVADDESLSTKEFIKTIAKTLGKNITLLSVPFFATMLKTFKPSFYKRLYESLEIDTTQSKAKLFGNAGHKLPFSVQEGVAHMIQGEDK